MRYKDFIVSHRKWPHLYSSHMEYSASTCSALWNLNSPYYKKAFAIVSLLKIFYSNKCFPLHNDCFLYSACLNIYLLFTCLTDLVIQLNVIALHKNNVVFVKGWKRSTSLSWQFVEGSIAQMQAVSPCYTGQKERQRWFCPGTIWIQSLRFPLHQSQCNRRNIPSLCRARKPEQKNFFQRTILPS